MKIKHHVKVIIGLAFLSAIATAPLVLAESGSSSLSDKQLENIRQTCVHAQVSLQRIQYSDTAARINRGQAYETLLTKLMAPLNSRVALNRLDMATELTADTTNLENAVSTFKDDYTNYSEALSDVLKVKCQDHPADFYAALTKARETRAQVHSDIQAMDGFIKQYDKSVVLLGRSLNANSSEVKSP